MTAPVLDDRYFPLVVNVLPPRLDADDVHDFLAKSERILRRQQPYVTITDTSALRELPTPMVRKALADWSKTHDTLMKRVTLGSAIVIASPLIRGGITALFWLAPPPYPTEVVATRARGLDAVRDFYERKLGHVPTGFASYRRELEQAAVRVAP